jgi:hypothetical protein
MFNQHFGNYLLKKKILKPEELRHVLEEQKLVKVKLGVLAVDSGYMNALQVERVHKLQAVRDKRFGELAIEEGYLTEGQLKELLNTQKKSNVLLGQVLIEKGLFSFEEYEEILRGYRQDSDLTDGEIQALKTNDVRKITEIFFRSLSYENYKMLHEYFQLFMRNIVRFIDDEISLEEVQKRDTYSFDYLATQRIEGDGGFFSGFSGSEAVMAAFASIYAEEKLNEINNLAKDALGEFMNCQNGLFLSHLSHEGIDLELFPAEVKKDGILKPVGQLYIIPCYLTFGKIDFIFSEKFPYFQ